MPDYRLTCSNRSNMHGSFAVFQIPPPTNSPGRLMSMAWMARPAAPNTRVSFSWSTTLSFIWGELGHLPSGGMFDASQCVAGDPMRENMIDLVQDSFGAPLFQNLRIGGPPGTMTINQRNAVFDYPVSIGIGMGDKPAYAIRANPNISTSFIPHESQFWVVFGAFRSGQIFDEETVSGALALEFDPMSPNRAVVLTPENILRPMSLSGG